MDKRMEPDQEAWQPAVPASELDSCGIGFVADIRGRAQHRVLQLGLEALGRLSHRGAINADGRTGDGTGVLTQIPYRLLVRELKGRVDLPAPGDLAIGMFFLPDQDQGELRARELIASVFKQTGLVVLDWRKVPTSPEFLGQEARQRCPRVFQILVPRPKALFADAFERRLYLARRRIESAARAANLDDLYVVSLSHRTIVYKSMALASDLARFYPDLGDPDYQTAIALFHQRFSTNTLPTWRLAQPFRLLAHNGEINTIQGNANWMAAREGELRSALWGEQLEELLPVIESGGSDSAMLDNALELLVMFGRDPLHAMMMLIPEAGRGVSGQDPEVQAFYEYHATLLEPWDGPAAVVFSDGRFAAACLDRNGLRPQRFWVTSEDLVILGSEAGIVGVPDESVIRKGRLGPGEMLAVDTLAGSLLTHHEIQQRYAKARPYAAWVRQHLVEVPELKSSDASIVDEPVVDTEVLVRDQMTFGYTREALERILEPMMFEARIPIGSMGNDTPLTVLSDQPHLLYSYFKQRFAQVTNPPIDSLREKSVFSLETIVGSWGCVIEEVPASTQLLRFPSPILSRETFGWLKQFASDPDNEEAFQLKIFPALFQVSEGLDTLRSAVERLCSEVEQAVDSGCVLVVLSDRGSSSDQAPIPMLLATGAVHHHLIRQRKRMQVSLICDTAEPREDHHFACLIGYGATLIHPYLVYSSIAARVTQQHSKNEGPDVATACGRYLEALENGLLKIMAKLGVCPIASYQGAQLFEALGLDADLVATCFAGTPSRVGGVGWRRIAQDAARRHALAHGEKPRLLDRGLFRFRKGGEQHSLRPRVFKALHKAVRQRDREVFATFVELSDSGEPSQLRDLLRWKPGEKPLPLEEVESSAAIVRRFITAAMSHGALSREAHETLAVAMNQLGGRSNSGEGGEDPRRFFAYEAGREPEFQGAWSPEAGDCGNSAIKQVASGRFGVTPRYLLSARELEIKMAQGSKPGEGGQIPGHKVSLEIAHLRRSAPGMPLISPPPHHDIYSIEDLAQLIFDLKSLHPEARVGVKLVSVAGVGTIAAGVAKAGADYIQISGDNGGTGASPLSSIKHAGMPWELGLADAQQVLVRSGLRDRVTLRVDGGLKTGRDLVIAALLGAEEFGFGTVPLIALGCVMARQCHLNTCPVGIATQRPELRDKFPGTPAHVISFMSFVAEEVRLVLGEMGVKTLDDIVGRVDLLESRPLEGLPDLDLSCLLKDFSEGGRKARRSLRERNDLGRKHGTLDQVLVNDFAGAIQGGTSQHRSYHITNAERSVGAGLTREIIRHLGSQSLAERVFRLEFTGAAGQSFGIFLPAGVSFILNGEAQDGVGKGLSGGEIILRPSAWVRYESHLHVIAGNALLYGATGGQLFAAGTVGERFCVRNSGATAVVEGCGDHGCEYMTRGVALVLGKTGFNFAAGMSGGVAYVYDEDGHFKLRLNTTMAHLAPFDFEDETRVLELLGKHVEVTGSGRARWILENWSEAQDRWCKVLPEKPIVSVAQGEAFVEGQGVLDAAESSGHDLEEVLKEPRSWVEAVMEVGSKWASYRLRP